MSVKLVINGYFRSGTTMLWGLLEQDLNDKDTVVLYEPFHTRLASYVRKSCSIKEVNELHGKDIWSGYRDKSINLEHLLRYHPSSPDIWIGRTIDIESYLSYLNKIPQDVILQPNRAHFCLDLFDENTKLIHVIRNPIEVFLSIRKAHISFGSNKNVFSKIYRLITYPITGVRAFETDVMFDWILNNLGYPYDYYSSVNLRVFKSRSLFYKFVSNWIVSNYFAVKSIKERNGLILNYNLFVKEDSSERDMLEEFLEFKVDFSDVRINKNQIIETKLEDKFFKVARELRLENELNFILKETSLVMSFREVPRC